MSKRIIPLILLACLLSLSLSQVTYAGTYFINVTGADYISVWTNTTETLDNQFYLDGSLYNGTRTHESNSDAQGISTGETQTHDVTVFVHGVDYGSFWTYYHTYDYMVRCSLTQHRTGNSDEHGLYMGLYLSPRDIILGGPIPPFIPVNYTLVSFGFVGIGFMIFAPCWIVFIINRRRRKTEQILITLGYAVLIFIVGFGMLVAWLWG